LKDRRPVRLIGLTGGIATGKSTATKCFIEAGARVIDADQLARRVVEPGLPALEEIRRSFGQGVIRADGTLDREALGAKIFGDSKARARLNEIVHPRVAEESRRQIDAVLREEPTALVVYDVPLLFEGELADQFDLVAVVYAPRSEQERRLAQRDGLSPEQVEARIRSQMDIEEKACRADVVLDNNGTIRDLKRQVEALVNRIRNGTLEK
jgi:dephospho-CoA kinase